MWQKERKKERKEERKKERERGENLPLRHDEEGIDAFALNKMIHDVGVHVGCICVKLEEGMVVASH